MEPAEDPNELVELEPGLTVRQSVLMAIKTLSSVPEVGIPFISRMVNQLGGYNQAARFMDTPDEHGVSPAEYILRGSQVDAEALLRARG